MERRQKLMVGGIVVCVALIVCLLLMKSPDDRAKENEDVVAQIVLPSEPPKELDREGVEALSAENEAESYENSEHRKPIVSSAEEALSLSLEEADRVVEKLKDSRFKRELQALNPQARRRAAATVRGMHLNEFELNELYAESMGRIYYKCHFNGAASAPESSFATSPGTGAAAVPISSPPIYHSNPGSINVLFLDFNGGEVSGTAWNENLSVDSFVCKPYSTDGDETMFSDSEQEDIRRIFALVAEDYAPFDVDVTTEEPLTFTATTGHAMITPTTDQNGVALPHDGAGGIAYVDVFGLTDPGYDYAYYSPAWVAEMGAKNTGEAAAHELGHNMGLSHDGLTDGTGYYTGHGSGVESWAPIMGAGYYKNVVQWSMGEYPDANQSQDDIAIIAGKTGFLADDHADTVGGSATTLNPSSSPAGIGIIEQENDVDVFQLTTAQVIEVTVTPNADDPNLNTKVDILNGSGTVLASDEPLADLGSSVSYVPPALDTYYVRVDGVGALDLTEGFSDYGSLGNYTVNVTLSDPVTLICTQTSVALPEGTSTSSIGVRLSGAPSSNVTVSATVTGDSDIVITSGSSLSFTTSNWSSTQYITVSANADSDGLDGSATITFSSSICSDTEVVVTEVDDDYAITMNSTGGGTVTPSFGFSPGGSAVTITATPSAGYTFGGWTVAGSNASVADAASATTTVTAIGDDTITAVFNLIPQPDDGDDGGCGMAGEGDWLLLLILVVLCCGVRHVTRLQIL